MTKYVEIEEAEKAFREAFKNPSEMGNAQAFINMLRHDVPSADVKPVVRGEWQGEPIIASYRVRRCNRCNQLSPEGYYCYNCGADMRGKENE